MRAHARVPIHAEGAGCQLRAVHGVSSIRMGGRVCNAASGVSERVERGATVEVRVRAWLNHCSNTAAI
eukprot:7814406-Alexandrium_andersonii.AAC.1